MVDQPHLKPAPVGEPHQHLPPRPRPVSIDDTTEIRWFNNGPLPDDIGTWFTSHGLPGLVEQRTDTYRLDHRCDTGIKRRFGRMLELKTRLGDQATLALDSKLTGRLETWRRWSPADSQIRLSPDEVWVDVHKTIVKRRFDGDGNEAPMTEAAYASIGVACDVEVAAIEVLGQKAWSLALAAIGPDTSRQDSILTTWAALGPNRPACLGSDLHLRDSCGYPEWLIKTTTPQHRGPRSKQPHSWEGQATPQPVADRPDSRSLNHRWAGGDHSS